MKYVTLPPSEDGPGRFERRAVGESRAKLSGIPSHQLEALREKQLRRNNFGGAVWIGREQDRRAEFVRRVLGGGNS